MGIKLKAVNQTYGGLKVLHDINLAIAEGEMIALVGPSGCGKTTLLKTIAGLLPLSQGQIWLKGQNISHLPAQDRNTAMVFQNYALFPHMSVAENITYGLKIRKVDTAQRQNRVREIVAKTELQGLENRKVSELSGGQQQRVALARALVIEPAVLLFDEPLSNLDQRLRVAMRQKIKQIQQEYRITSIYVTHDQDEALSIADRIVVLNEGRIEQVGSPAEIYLYPRNRFVAEFIAVANILKLSDHEEIRQHLGLRTKSYPSAGIAHGCDTGKSIYLMFRPEDVTIDPGGDLSGTVVWQETLGAVNKLTINYQGTPIFAEIRNYFKSGLNIKNDGQIKFSIDLASAHIFVE